MHLSALWRLIETHLRIPGGLVCVLLVVLPCAAQEKMSREDTAAILFSNRFSFTSEGEPVLSIRIMEEQKSISFIAPDGLSIQPSGPGGPTLEVRGKLTWTLSTSATTPARLGWRVVLDEWATADFERGRQAAVRFTKEGIETTRIEMGTLFSFQGTVFDTRTTLLCSQPPVASYREADELRVKLQSRFQGSYRLIEVLAERPSGDVILEQRDRGVRVSARNAVWFEPLGRELTVENVEYAKGFPWHGRETPRYSGQFYAAVDRSGMLALANVLPAEELLRGLVPAEIYPDSPSEALKAQAVTARNELFSKIGHRHLADPFLLCGDQHCQVYKGLGAHRKQADQAVRDTRGNVMFDGEGRLADARYHSTCGGHTENAVEAWPEVTSPNLVGRSDSPAGKGDPYAPLTDG
ncbi:MAG: SpoIID/LytB domain-containing protein, partial [Deltaproteobacteria bacterium]|nr:SpoIID/LytB domain-containing protein [Deltaproteobacteria bacterium]